MTHLDAAQRINNAIIRADSIPPHLIVDEDDHAANVEALELARDTLLQVPAFEKKLERLRDLERELTLWCQSEYGVNEVTELLGEKFGIPMPEYGTTDAF